MAINHAQGRPGIVAELLAEKGPMRVSEIAAWFTAHGRPTEYHHATSALLKRQRKVGDVERVAPGTWDIKR